MSNENPQAEYYQTVVTDITARNERLTEQIESKEKALIRLRTEVQELRTIISICALFVAAVEGRGLLDENDLYRDMVQRLNSYLDSKKVAS